jgi:glycosyltransferase involved in cell wall biosynthesis
MTEHLVLIFAYHFPPENTIGGARPFRFSKYLSRLGYTCRVFTAADQTGRNDPDTEFVPDPFVSHSRQGIGSQLERVVRKFLLHGDVGMQWSIHAARAARKCVRAHSDARVTIFSTFPPLGSHLAAWQLVRGEKYPWIADFRDPMRNERLDERINPLHKKVDRWLEDVWVRRADAVIGNTDAAMARWRKEFPSIDPKVHLIWNGFDPEERVLPLPVPSRDCRVLSHTGELYCGRSVAPILESLARLITKGRLTAGNVLVRLIGPAEAGTLPNQQLLDRARNEGWLELRTEQIPKDQALQIARSSDTLLLLQQESAIQVPGKLFEYLQIGRPILAFIQPGSPSERLLEQSGVLYRCVYPDSSPKAIDDAVTDFFNLPSTATVASPWVEEQFNAENQTRQLDNIIRFLHPDTSSGTQGLPGQTLASERSMVEPNREVRGRTH